MLIFWLVAGVMLLLALAFALVPLLRARKDPEVSRRDANLAVLRTQREELDRDVAFGTLPAAARDEALDELVTRASEDLAASEEAASSPGSRPWKSIAALAVLLPAFAVGLYFAIGNPAAIDVARQGHASPEVSDKQIEAMVASLGEKVKARPDDAQGWHLYARSLNAMGRWNEASEAYAHLATLVPDDASVLADWADALAMTQGKNLSGKPCELVRRVGDRSGEHQGAGTCRHRVVERRRFRGGTEVLAGAGRIGAAGQRAGATSRLGDHRGARARGERRQAAHGNARGGSEGCATHGGQAPSPPTPAAPVPVANASLVTASPAP